MSVRALHVCTIDDVLCFHLGQNKRYTPINRTIFSGMLLMLKVEKQIYPWIDTQHVKGEKRRGKVVITMTE